MSKTPIKITTKVVDSTHAMEQVKAKLEQLDPVQWLNFEGDIRGQIGQVVGPMLDSDQLLTVVREEYDEKTNRTRLGLTYGAPESLA